MQTFKVAEKISAKVEGQLSKSQKEILRQQVPFSNHMRLMLHQLCVRDPLVQGCILLQVKSCF